MTILDPNYLYSDRPDRSVLAHVYLREEPDEEDDEEEDDGKRDDDGDDEGDGYSE